ncbi:MAG: four helix bundle protein [Chitinophagaceae bacterium]|nr:four helix bundle protein [Chitinophagaceae bacterium]
MINEDKLSKLEVWKSAMHIGVEIYKLSLENECLKKDFSIRDQIRKCALSISNNIAEGLEYNNNNDFARFLRIAKGSCGETRNCVIFLSKIGYITSSEEEIFCCQLIVLSKQLGSFISYLKSIKPNTKDSTRNPKPITTIS